MQNKELVAVEAILLAEGFDIIGVPGLNFQKAVNKKRFPGITLEYVPGEGVLMTCKGIHVLLPLSNVHMIQFESTHKRAAGARLSIPEPEKKVV